ncbi:MAG: hypothetical protein QOF33_5004 [Thermomicrobiales bacterium]|nr:hypothetical protein [Thermomicrobiales bacterium]MEA2586919.1 hypothetical protein [Thermomicrobiales bacterium]
MIEDPESPLGRRSRLEDEVLEILYRSDRPPSLTDRARATLRRSRRSLRWRPSAFMAEIASGLDSGLWFVACIVLGVVAFFVRDASPFLARMFAVLCLALIILAIVRSFSRPNRGMEKRWRGRDFDISPSSRPLWLDRVFRGQRRPPRR